VDGFLLLFICLPQKSRNNRVFVVLCFVVESPVFHDPRGRRWRRVRRIWLALSVVVTGLAIIFIASVLASPVLPSLSL
jgi:hypothetical protein